jgi:hypothetical protein
VTLLAILTSFWLLTGLQRAEFGGPDSSRYLYAGALFVVLLATELARGVALSRPVAAVLAAAVALAVVANLGDLRDAGRLLREQAQSARADLAALELARPAVPPGYIAASFPGYPFLLLEAEPYFEAARQLGSPADSAAELAAAPEPARMTADSELVRIYGVAVEPGGRTAEGDALTVDAVSGGSVSRLGACVTFRPEAARPATLTPELQLTLPPGGLRLTTDAGPATVTARRFAAGFSEQPLSTLSASSTGTLRIARDLADTPWHVRVAPQAPVTACALA